MISWPKTGGGAVRIVLRLTFCSIVLLACSTGVEGGEPTSAAPKSEPAERPALRPPVVESAPRIDGKLDEPIWKTAARTGSLKGSNGRPAKSKTEAFICRDADYLYVGVTCAVKAEAETDAKPVKRRRKKRDVSQEEHVALLIDSNNDRKSYYVILIAPDGHTETYYGEHRPPWVDRTWRPTLKSAAAVGANGWNMKIAIPFSIFHKNKTLTSEIGFNIRRYDAAHGETCSWSADFSNPRNAGILKGIPAREDFPPTYMRPGRRWRKWTRLTPEEVAARLAEENRTIELGPGSAHPGATGEARLELEGFLIEGDPHACAVIWDVAVDEKKGELYVLCVARMREGPEVRVFDRQGAYLRTIMPYNPTLPRAGVKDLCRQTAVEGGVKLVVARMFDAWGLGNEFALYGNYYHLPQKLALAPNGDLIMANIYRATLWRIRPDGSLPPERWTSVYHPGRNEPLRSLLWIDNIADFWRIKDLKNYLPFPPLHYPYLCFGRDGQLYVSQGRDSNTSELTKWYGMYLEIGSKWALERDKGHGTTISKFRPFKGVTVDRAGDFRFNGEQELTEARNFLGVEGKPGKDGAHFSGPCGMVLDADHLIVADSDNNRLQVFEKNGRLAASIQSYEHEGKSIPLQCPTALAIDRDKCLYALVESGGSPELAKKRRKSQPKVPRKLIKLKSWKQPELLAVSEPLHKDVLQITVDSGVNPPLVWIANAAGWGTLRQLAGDDLSLRGEWGDNQETLSSPNQYAGPPILNIDPQTGHIYIEDDSEYQNCKYGTVHRIDRTGKIIKTWPPVFFSPGKRIIINYTPIIAEDHFRYPDEPLFIDSTFGKDGKIYRWKRTDTEMSILRFDRAGKPVPFEATGTNALIVARGNGFSRRATPHIHRGMDVDKRGAIYYATGRGVDVYDSKGNLQKKRLVGLGAIRGIQVDERGNLYALALPPNPWYALSLYKFSPSGGKPLWLRNWEGIIGRNEVRDKRCTCTKFRLHQALDGRGYLYAAGTSSVQVIDCETGKLVGEFGSYGNRDCRGKGSAYPHPELPFGIITALAVWKDRLFVVDGLNKRIVKCRIIYDPAKKKR